MKVIQIPVESRERTGSAESRRLRRAGRLPVSLYGLGRDPSNLTVDAHAFAQSFDRGRRMFELVSGEKTEVCLLKDVSYDHLGTNVLHADLLRVDDTKPVTATVALEFVGNPDSPSGAIVDLVRNDIHVTALPRAIPETIEVNIAGLPIGERITCGELKLPDGVELVEAPERTVVTHHFKSAGAESAAAAEEGEEDEGEESPEA